MGCCVSAPNNGPIIPGSKWKNRRARNNKKSKTGTTYAEDLVNNSKERHSGKPEDCNPQQRELLNKLREFVNNLPIQGLYTFDDNYLMRFLAGFNFDLTKTQNAFESYITYRKSHNIELDTYDYTVENKLKHYYPRNIFGVDNQGRPVLIERLGCANFKKVYEVCSQEDMTRIYCHENERLQKEIFPVCAAAVGKPVKDFIFILDLSGMNHFPSGVKEFLGSALRPLTDWYPDTLAMFLVCNIPSKYLFFINMIYGFASESTKKKIKLVKDLTRLQEIIDIDNLPDFLGGTNSVEDYGELFDIEKGPWVKKNQI